MRTKLALLVAAAAVFAPGWGTETVAPSASGVVGRMLAPDPEAASIASEQGASRALTTWGRSKPASLWSKVPAHPPQSSGLFPLELFCAAVAIVVLFGLALRPAPRSPRAPPHVTV